MCFKNNRPLDDALFDPQQVLFWNMSACEIVVCMSLCHYMRSQQTKTNKTKIKKCEL